MPRRTAPTITTLAVLLAVLLAALTGCAHPNDQPSAEKVKAALQRLGANPATIYFEPFVAKSPANNQLSRQVLILVPPKDGQGLKIVDSHGDIFDDYDDFLSNNTLPDQPG